ncbi:nitroreductase [[Clostridium] innocuum]|nr:nitroreductase [[Clostridium] innocuum]
MLKDAIKQRHSRRSYLHQPLRDEDVSFLKTRIHEYNQRYGLHMKLVCGHPEIFKGFRNSYGMFHNVENFIMMMGNFRDVYMQEKLGYFGERLVLEAVGRNMGTCWVGGTFAKAALAPYVKEGEQLYCVIAVGYTADKKSMKEVLISRATRRKGKTIEEMSNYTPKCPDWMKSGMEAVQLAPSALFRQPVNFQRENDCVYAEVSHPETHEMLDLGIAMLHFEIGANAGSWTWGNPAVFQKK